MIKSDDFASTLIARCNVSLIARFSTCIVRDSASCTIRGSASCSARFSTCIVRDSASCTIRGSASCSARFSRCTVRGSTRCSAGGNARWSSGSGGVTGLVGTGFDTADQIHCVHSNANQTFSLDANCVQIYVRLAVAIACCGSCFARVRVNSILPDAQSTLSVTTRCGSSQGHGCNGNHESKVSAHCNEWV
ncbi:hypothetical protein BC940DRAFT_354820, partial [Gongronella butleri]